MVERRIKAAKLPAVKSLDSRSTYSERASSMTRALFNEGSAAKSKARERHRGFSTGLAR